MDRATVCAWLRDRAVRKRCWSPQRGLGAQGGSGEDTPGGWAGAAAGHCCTNPHGSEERSAKLIPENYTIFLKETRRDLNEMKDIPCSWMEDNGAETPIFPGLDATPLRSSAGFFAEIDKPILKFE